MQDSQLNAFSSQTDIVRVLFDVAEGVLKGFVAQIHSRPLL